MQNRSYKQLLDRVREMEVSSYESTASRFLHSLERRKSTPAISKKLLVRSSLGVIAIALILTTVLRQQHPMSDVPRQTILEPVSAAVNLKDRQKHRSETPIAEFTDSAHASASAQSAPAIIAGPEMTDGNTDAASIQRDKGSLEIALTITSIQPVLPANVSLLSSRELSSLARVELQSETPIKIQLFATYAGVSGLTPNGAYGRGTMLVNISEEYAIGIATGLLIKEHVHSEFAGFRDTLVRIGSQEYASRVGYFTNTTRRSSHLGIGAAFSYRPHSLIIAEAITPSFMLIGGFDGTQYFVEPSVLVMYPISGRFSAIAGLSASTPLSALTVRMFPVAGISASF